jgi:hypothetical protein
MDNFDGDVSYWLHYYFLCVVSEEIKKFVKNFYVKFVSYFENVFAEISDFR